MRRDEIDILHQRERAKPADLIVEAARNEQSLVAIGQSEQPHAQRDPALDERAPARRRRRGAESK